MLQSYNARNADIKIWVGDRLYSREEAKVSVFDSVVQGGDAVWEGLRVYDGGIFLLDRHLRRLRESAHAMAFREIPPADEIREALFATLKENEMMDGVHVRLTLTRGLKTTSGMDPRLNTSGPTLIILPEWKSPVYDNQKGITVITSSIRRNSPANLDSKIHHNNLINNILAKIEANHAGVDAALMLDNYGFASELNGTNIFMVRDDKIFTPHADACLPGITRGFIMEIANNIGLQVIEKNISLTEIYNAEILFCTGTMGEITPINSVDGRIIRNRSNSVILQSLVKSFKSAIPHHCVNID